MSPYLIAQEPEEIKLAVALQRSASIFTICLIESTACRKSPISEKVSVPFGFSAEFRPEACERDGRILNISTHFSLKIISDADKAELVELQCLIGAEYVLAEGFDPSPEQLKAFKEGPAIFNCWPYFREYAQNTVTRMNYPPPTIPFLWLEARKEAPASPASADRSKKEKPAPPPARKKAPEGN